MKHAFGDVQPNCGNLDHGYGNKRRAIVPINPELEKTLVALKELSCSEYVVEFRGYPVMHIKKGFAAACKRANLAGVTPHILRHTAATWMVMAGVPLAEVARMLGDEEATVERVYAKHTPEYLARASSALQLMDDGDAKRLTGVRQLRVIGGDR